MASKASVKYTLDELWDIASALLGHVLTDYIDFGMFKVTPGYQKIAIDAILDFLKGDIFFKAAGDKIYPNYMGYGFEDVIASAVNLLKPATIKQRINNNILLVPAIRLSYQSRIISGN